MVSKLEAENRGFPVGSSASLANVYFSRGWIYLELGDSVGELGEPGFHFVDCSTPGSIRAVLGAWPPDCPGSHIHILYLWLLTWVPPGDLAGGATETASRSVVRVDSTAGEHKVKPLGEALEGHAQSRADIP